MLKAEEITLSDLIQWYSRELGSPPCDCVEIIDGHYCSRCDCRNQGDAENMAVWCDEKNQEPKRQATLRYLKMATAHDEQQP